MVQLSIRNESARRPERHGVPDTQGHLAEGRFCFHVMRVEREAEERLLARRAVGVAVVAAANLRERRPARARKGSALGHGFEITLDDSASGLRRRLREKELKLLARECVLTAFKLGTGELDAGAGEFRLGGD